MARTYRLWAERDPGTGRLTACGMTPLTKEDEPQPGSDGWERLGRAAETDFRHEGPWALLLYLLNMERRIQPDGWPFGVGRGYTEWIEANKGFPAPNWTAWKRFGQEFQVPYFVTDDYGCPVLWFPATDGEWYGFMLHFGMQDGRASWVAGQPLHYESVPGRTRIVMGERHEVTPTLVSLEQLMETLPSGLFSAQRPDYRSLRDVLKLELARHEPEESERCRFYMYHPLSPGHGEIWNQDAPFAVQTLEGMRGQICGYAWLWLSPLAGLWPFGRDDMADEVNGDPNVDKPETAEKLAALTPQQKYAMTVLGTSIWTHSGRDPLSFLLERVRPQTGVAPTGAPRVLSSLLRQSKNEFWRAGETDRARQTRQRDTRAARKRLIRAARIREHFVTTDIFAAAAMQLQWAVQAERTLLACPHPGCGVAFFREPTYHGRFCSEHRGEAARQARSRLLRAQDGPPIQPQPPA